MKGIAVSQRIDDYDLISSAKYGDSHAFQILLIKYGNRIYKRCLHMLRDPNDSEDITQEVFLKVYLNIENYEISSTSFYTWIYRITTNCCIDFLRKRKKLIQNRGFYQWGGSDYIFPKVDPEIQDNRFRPDNKMMQKEMLNMVGNAIANLPEKLQMTTYLKEIQGLNHIEIAAILKCSKATVKSRLFRARGQIKTYLESYM